MTRHRFLIPATVLLVGLTLKAVGQQLPFDQSAINRYSLDGVPRSMSIRQGADIWLGYDLERATILKVWRAPEGELGLKGAFTVKSAGTKLFEDKSETGWTWDGGPVKVRYLGVSDKGREVELRWELSKGARSLRLTERIPKSGGEAVSRDLKVDGLRSGESLKLPAAAGAAWKTTKGGAAKELSGNQWIRITLS